MIDRPHKTKHSRPLPPVAEALLPSGGCLPLDPNSCRAVMETYKTRGTLRESLRFPSDRYNDLAVKWYSRTIGKVLPGKPAR
jgi:hypothetical protein